jgi:hypothetical protein
MNKHVVSSDPELKSPWSTLRGRLEYELALCDREIAGLVGAVDNLECELEALYEEIGAYDERFDSLKAQLSELED